MGENIYSLVIGVDEAGRGPLIGDLVVVAIGFKQEVLKHLKILGVKDSKLLDKKRREKLYYKIIDLSEFIGINYISPLMIDSENINKLISEHIVSIFRILSRKINMYLQVSIFIDEVKGYNEFLYKKLRKILNNITQYVMEPDADKKYLPVSAASIVAKYIRDRNISCLSKVFGELGSGYPSDPKTIKWVSETYNTMNKPPLIIRKTWSTLKKYAPKWYSPSKIRRTHSILEYFSMGDKGYGD
jgi:ribonuclease HII